ARTEVRPLILASACFPATVQPERSRRPRESLRPVSDQFAWGSAVFDCGLTVAFSAIVVLGATLACATLGRCSRTADAPGNPGKRGHSPCASAARLGDLALPVWLSYIQ